MGANVGTTLIIVCPICNTLIYVYWYRFRITQEYEFIKFFDEETGKERCRGACRLIESSN